MKRGKYIVIEGPDGTGKTTQADLLMEYLKTQGIKSIHVKEPGGTPIGEELRLVILNGTLERTAMTNLLLFTAIRHELWNAKILPALQSGTWVICTRNYWSTLAYQGVGEGMDQSIIDAVTSTFTDKSYMQPDSGIILHFTDEEERRARIANRGKLKNPDTFEMRATDFQAKVTQAYVDISTERNLPIIDAGQSIDEVHREILQVIG